MESSPCCFSAGGPGGATRGGKVSDLTGTPATDGTTVSPKGPQALRTGCMGACRHRSRTRVRQGGRSPAWQPGSQGNAGERQPWQRAPTPRTPPDTGTAAPEQQGASLSLGLPVTRAPQRPKQGHPCCLGVSRHGTRVSTSAHAPASLPGLTVPEVGESFCFWTARHRPRRSPRARAGGNGWGHPAPGARGHTATLLFPRLVHGN